MDEKQFKKHLKDLVHGRHHPEEHGWDQTPEVRKAGRVAETATKTAKRAAPKSKRRTRQAG